MAKYTLEVFRYFISREQVDCLLSIHQANNFNKITIIECLQIITEALIWSDQNNSDFFSYYPNSIFKSSAILSKYSKLLSQDFDKSITIQLLQSTNILIHNLKDPPNKAYLLKHSFYREILSHPFDFTDDEIIENYMSLIKGLAVNLPINQLKDYLVENHYALFTGAMMFFNYPEALVKTASRTVVLRVLTVSDQVVETFIWEAGFYQNLISNVKESIMSITRSTVACNNLSKLEQLISEFLDLLYHINDIFSLDRDALNEKLFDILLKLLVLPILVSSIIEEKPKSHHIPMSIALYSLAHIINIVKFPKLTSTLLELLFAKRIPVSYFEVMKNPPNRSAPLMERSEESMENVVFLTLMSFLKCKEDNLIGLSLSIVQSVFANSIRDFFESVLVPGQEIHRDLMEIFTGIILAEEELRFFSCFLASKLFFEVFQAGLEFSDRESFLEISKNAQNKHSEILLSAINSKNSNIVTKFQQEWEFMRTLKWNEHLDLPLNYILPSIDELSSMIPLQNRRNHSEEDFLRTEIRLFLLYRKLRRLLSGVPIEITEENPLKFLFESKIKKGQHYKTTEGPLKNNQMMKVYEKGYYKTVKYIVQDDHFFILGSLNFDGSIFHTEISSRFSKIDSQAQSEPNVEVLLIEGHDPFSLFFERFDDWMSLKNKLKKKREECLSEEFSQFKNFISK